MPPKWLRQNKKCKNAQKNKNRFLFFATQKFRAPTARPLKSRTAPKKSIFRVFEIFFARKIIFSTAKNRFWFFPYRTPLVCKIPNRAAQKCKKSIFCIFFDFPIFAEKISKNRNPYRTPLKNDARALFFQKCRKNAVFFEKNFKTVQKWPINAPKSARGCPRISRGVR